MCFATQHRALFEHLNFQKCYISTSKSAPSPTVFSTLDFDMCFAPQRNALFSTAQLPQSTNGPRPSVFSLLTSTCAASACTFLTALLPKVVWDLQFFTFDFHMCFAPQLHALFRHSNFQKCSGSDVFCTFWLRNLLRTTAACNFFISHLPRWLRTRRFSEPTWTVRSHKTLENTVFRDVSTFRAPASSFFWLFSSLIFFLSQFLLCDSSHLCFSIYPFCLKFGF